MIAKYRTLFNFSSFCNITKSLLISLGLVCSILVTRVQADNSTKKKPNIVLIFVDDLGWKDLTCYGSKYYETPNIDRLATEGITFTNAYAACPVCSPSRASILTGKYPARLGLTHIIQARPVPNKKLATPATMDHLPLEEITIAEALKPAGYYSASIGKWHLGGYNNKHLEAGNPLKQGFDLNIAGSDIGQPPDYFYPYKRNLGKGKTIQLTNMPSGKKGDYLTDVVTDEAIKFIKQNKEKPFFLYLSYFSVHTAMGDRLQAKPETIAKYKEKLDPNYDQKNPVYAAMVEHLDTNVGRLLAKLKEFGLNKNTVVIFTSDNGGYGSRTSHLPLRGAKATPYEGGMRVPAIVRWTGTIRPGSVSNTPIITNDIYPTIAEIAGVKLKSNGPIDGKSIIPLLKGKKTIKRKALFWHFPHYCHGFEPWGAVRQDNYKLIEFFETNRLELYDLSKDIGEKHNLAEKMPGKAKELQSLLAKWRKSVGAKMPRLKNEN